jgi:hypothetical protein
MLATVLDELQGLDDRAITRRLRDLELERRRVDAELLATMSVAQARGVYREDGHHGLAGWVRANLNWSNAQVSAARQQVRLIDDHPVVGDALHDGHIGVAQVAEMARARANPRCGGEIGDVIDLLVDHAEFLPHPDFRAIVRRWETLADLDGAHAAADVSEANRTASAHEVGGGLDLRASGGSAISTAAMLAIFEGFVEAEFAADVAARTAQYGPYAAAALLPRTDAQRRFDALCAIFRRAAATPAGGRLPAPLVNIVIDQTTFETVLAQHRLIPPPDDLEVADLIAARCETVDGIPVPPDDVLQAALRGLVRRVVVDTDGVVIDMGRSRRLFTGAARDAVKFMEAHCGHPGCVVSARHAQIDHLDEWDRDHGATDVRNGRPRCEFHNRVKHRLGLVDRRLRQRIVTYRRDGSPIIHVGARLPDPDDPDETTGPTGLDALFAAVEPLLDR